MSPDGELYCVACSEVDEKPGVNGSAKGENGFKTAAGSGDRQPSPVRARSPVVTFVHE